MMRVKRSQLVIAASIAAAIMAGAFIVRPAIRSHYTSLQRGQCTWYAFQRAGDDGWHIVFDTNWGRHGRAWWDKVVNAERGDKPRPGAIMVLDAWPGNEYGHVAYVDSVENDNRWTISQANMSAPETCGEREGVTIYKAVIERAPGGVRFAGSVHVFRLRGFLYPPSNRTTTRLTASWSVAHHSPPV